jgi:uncharacterized protein
LRRGALVRRVVGALLVGAGVLVGVAPGGVHWAVAGVIIMMVGFQMLTLRTSGVAYVAGALLAVAGLSALSVRHHLSLAELGLGPHTWVRGAIWALAILVVVSIAMGIAGGWPRIARLFADDRVTGSSGRVAARRALFDIPLGTVLVEEFAFRGVMFALLLESHGTAAAVVVTSVLFGLWHVAPSFELHASHEAVTGQAWTTILGTVVFTGLAGVIFAMLRVWTSNLLPPAALHWSVNAGAVIAGWFVGRRSHLEAKRSQS